jgi:FtsP/CotA-like multicopper oxidase with cupredoxin domain
MRQPTPFLAKDLISRRRFVQGLVSGGVLATLSPLASAMSGMFGNVSQTSTTGIAPVLTGTEFHLTISEAMVNFTGSPRIATVINGMIPAPTLQFREGDEVTIHVKNDLSEDTSIHWHGIILP